jgi:subtilisin family serine protease
MRIPLPRWRSAPWKMATGTLAVLVLGMACPTLAQAEAVAQYVVADSAGVGSAQASADVGTVDGTVLSPLPAADGVLAQLTSAQVTELEADASVTVTANVTITMSSTATLSTESGMPPAAVFPQQTGATQLWAKGDLGAGVNVAVVDTGIDPLPDFAGRLLPGVDLTGGGNPYSDAYGHGTFVAGLIAGDGASSDGLYKGEAPEAGLVSVKVAGADGQTDLATVIEGIDWVIAHQASEDIGVMNLSLGYVPTESTVVDPLDQAVERAWEAGIVVVVSAGNDGPFNGPVLSPGDDPFVITVGSVNDHGAVSAAGDTMSDFSSVGPTPEDGWFKPDVVAPGTSVVSLMAPGSTVADDNPQAMVGAANFVGSGTSFSSAVTSGAVALLRAQQPHMQPDDVKGALLGTASPGPVGDPFVDGHGLLNVAAAAASPGLSLQQGFGQARVSQPVQGNFEVVPGASVQAGFSIQVPGHHPALTSSLAGGQLTLPVSCIPGGAAVGGVEVDFPTSSYDFQAGANVPLPGAGSLQGLASAPNLCNGGPVYGAGQGAQATFSGALLSTDTTDPEHVEFYYSGAAGAVDDGGGANVVPVVVTEPGSSINLSTTWQYSTWDPAAWKGLPPTATSPMPASSATSASTVWSTQWDGSAWDGHVWNGNSWVDSDWQGHLWNSSAWDGNAWDGHVWDGNAWDGHVWDGSSWGTASPVGASTATAPGTAATTPYPGYSLVSTSPDLWCPQGANLGHAGQPGKHGNSHGGVAGAAGAAGCGSNGGNGGNGGSGTSTGAPGGAGGNGGAGGCPPSTDAQMVAGQYPCIGNGANGGTGGNGGNAANTMAGGGGGQGGNGGDATNAKGGNGANGANASPLLAGGNGGNGGNGGGCALYNASYWVSCAANGGAGGQGGNAGPGQAGGNGGNGGPAGPAQGANGGNGGNGGNSGPAGAGQAGQSGTAGGATQGASGANGTNG